MTRDPDCIFCKIVAGELPATVVSRTDGLIAIEDINPKADVHLLVIPERHFADFREIGVLSGDEAKRMLDFIAATARGARPASRCGTAPATACTGSPPAPRAWSTRPRICWAATSITSSRS